MQKQRFSLRRVLLIGTTLILLALQAAALFSSVGTPLQDLEFSTRDWMMHLRGPREPSGQVVIIAIDDTSIAWMGQPWPWPRSFIGEIVTAMDEAGAKVIGLDILLLGEQADPAEDEALARALAEAHNTVAVMRISPDPLQPGVDSLSLPAQTIRDSLDAFGVSPLEQDADAITRSVQAYSVYSNTVYFNWAFDLARLYLDVPGPSNPSSLNLTFNNQIVPLQRGAMLVNFVGPANKIKTYSVVSLMEGDLLEMDPDALRGKIVLLGATTPTLHDTYPTPFSARDLTPGVEIVANALENILAGEYLRESPPWVALLAIILAALLASVLTRSKRPSLTVLYLALSMIAYAALGYYFFVNKGLYLPLAGPQAMLFLGVLLPTLEQAVSQEVEKRRVHNLFGRFISPEMVDQLVSTQDINSLNKRANLTILFSDIRGFTTLSEKMTPEEVVAMLNPYLEAMTDVIYRHGGTVDKYEGDAIVAFFGEPVSYADHALRSVRAALDMRKALDELKRKWEREGHPRPNLEMGIGLNSGDVFVGLLGSAQRINYTVIGDAANLASRLQDLTKTYNWPVLISESTYEQVSQEFDADFADSVTVKGKTQPVNVYKLSGRRGSKTDRITGWNLTG